MMNLSEENPQVTVPNLKKAVGWEFLRTKALSLKDGGMELAQQQKGFHMVNPTENWFPGKLLICRDEQHKHYISMTSISTLTVT